MSDRYAAKKDPIPSNDSILSHSSSDDDLPLWIERDFDRRAVLPRCMVALVLLFGALIDFGHNDKPTHWIVLLTYGLVTFGAAAASRVRQDSVRKWVPRVATILDAAIALYMIGDHVPRDGHEARHATDALSLLPAFLLLLQTGLRLRQSLVITFAGLVAVGWAGAIVAFYNENTLGAVDGMSVLTRQGVSLAAFLAASVFVGAAVTGTRRAASAAMRAREDRFTLARFLPQGVALDVIRGGDAAKISERHACLVAIDLRGSSEMARTRPSADVVRWLLEFRRTIHDCVSANGGIIDKYVGDGVLALFLGGTAESQAEETLLAVRSMIDDLAVWNARRGQDAEPELRMIVSIHSGRVLAGVFDDGRRSEFTVLGPAMNDLARIERKAKEADVDVVASADFMDLVAEPLRIMLNAVPLDVGIGSEAELPPLFVLARSGNPSRPRPEPAGGSLSRIVGRLRHAPMRGEVEINTPEDRELKPDTPGPVAGPCIGNFGSEAPAAHTFDVPRSAMQER
jgi:adenylate cyclase